MDYLYNDWKLLRIMQLIQSDFITFVDADIRYAL